MRPYYHFYSYPFRFRTFPFIPSDRFSASQDIGKKDNLKTSVARKVKKDLAERYPSLAANLDEMFPKKDPLIVYKSRDHVSFLAIKDEIVFFSIRDGPYYPTLRLVQRYPDMISRLQVDRGAIPFVLKGAPIMAVGFVSKGGAIPKDLPEGTPVAIFAEGKEHPMAIGVTTMSTETMKSGNVKGTGCENIHYMGDGLWHSYTL